MLVQAAYSMRQKIKQHVVRAALVEDLDDIESDPNPDVTWEEWAQLVLDAERAGCFHEVEDGMMEDGMGEGSDRLAPPKPIRVVTMEQRITRYADRFDCGFSIWHPLDLDVKSAEAEAVRLCIYGPGTVAHSLHTGVCFEEDQPNPDDEDTIMELPEWPSLNSRPWSNIRIWHPPLIWPTSPCE